MWLVSVYRSVWSRCPIEGDSSSRLPRTIRLMRSSACWQRFPDFEAAAAALRGWETRYNYERFSLALQGRTPAEKLAALSPPRRAA